jgi:hypothetical protein
LFAVAQPLFGPRLWLRHNRGAGEPLEPPEGDWVLDLEADAITGLDDEDPVALWPDASEFENHLAQSDPDLRPLWIEAATPSGLPAVWSSAAGGEVLKCEDNTSLALTELTCIGVVRGDGIVNGNPFFIAKNGSAVEDSPSWGIVFVGGNSLSLSMDIDGEGWGDYYGSALTVEEWYIITARYDATTGAWSLRVNGANDASGTVEGGIVPTTGTLCVCGYDASFDTGEYWNGFIAVIKLADYAVDTADVEAWESYLNLKYEIYGF